MCTFSTDSNHVLTENERLELRQGDILLFSFARLKAQPLEIKGCVCSFASRKIMYEPEIQLRKKPREVFAYTEE